MTEIEKLPLQKYTPIRCRLRNPRTFDKSYNYKPIDLSNGITALVGVQNGQDNLKVQTLLFNTDPNKNIKVWSLKKAKKWLKENKQGVKTKIFLKSLIPFIKKPAPVLLTKEQLEKGVEKLRRHFERLPKRINKF